MWQTGKNKKHWLWCALYGCPFIASLYWGALPASNTQATHNPEPPNPQPAEKAPAGSWLVNVMCNAT